MIKVFMVLFLLSIASIGKAASINDDLSCQYGRDGLSCVSKVSILKDTQQLRVLKLEEEKLILEIEQLKAQAKKRVK